jgi:hypothetical protein
LEVARSFAELTHRAMSGSEISLAAADLNGICGEAGSQAP